MKVDFIKPARTWLEQLELLESRGLNVPDLERAQHYLAHINYYRLTGYWLPFEEDHATHRFNGQANFDDVLNLYVFDRELRLLVLDATERIEVSLRAQWAYHMAHRHGPHSYLDAKHASDPNLHALHMTKLKKEIERSDEVFIHHYRNTYRHPPSPPIWAVSEIMSLGTLSRWVTHMVPSDRSALARTYGLDQGVLKGFLQHLTHVRNLCAHHCRLWNRRFTVTMPLPRRKPVGFISSFNSNQPRRIYNTLVMLAALMDIVSPGHEWKARLREMMVTHKVDHQSMGFPGDWVQRPVWACLSGQQP